MTAIDHTAVVAARAFHQSLGFLQRLDKLLWFGMKYVSCRMFVYIYIVQLALICVPSDCLGMLCYAGI